MMVTQANDEIVYIVDDDPQIRATVQLLLDSVDIRAESFSSAEHFLAGRNRRTDVSECLIVDLCLPGMDGVQLQEHLEQARIAIPVILISAFGDVPTAVKSIQLGAVTFLEKPFKRVELLKQIRIALDRKSRQMEEERWFTTISERLATLTERERETLDLMVAGKSTKQIAAQFRIGTKTVAKHQTRVLDKMDVENVVELVHVMDGFV